MPLDACRICSHCEHLSTPRSQDAWVLLCRLAGDVLPLRTPRGPWESAQETPVSAAMSTGFCLASDVPVPILARVYVEESVDVAVVMGADGHPAGVVSRTDLLRALSRAGAGNKLCAKDIMTPFVMSFLDTTPIADAVKLMATQYVHHVPVVAGGKVLGVVSAAGLLNWLRSQLDDTLKDD